MWKKELSVSASENVLKTLSEVTISEIGSLSLIRGCVNCSRKEVLSYKAPSSETCTDESFDQKQLTDSLTLIYEKHNIFFKLFHYICLLCEGDITIHYHAFQVLVLWFSRLTKLASSQESSIVSNFTSVWERAIYLVLLNMDSPIEDVPEAVVEIFGYLLGVWNEYKDRRPGLLETVLEKIMSCPWYVKGKYRLLSILLKYTDSDKVSEYVRVMLCNNSLFKRNAYTYNEGNPVKIFLTSLSIGVCSKWKGNLLLRCKFFPFGVDLISKEPGV